MKSFETPVEHRDYPIRLVIQDALIILTPTILMLIGILWVYRKEWDSVELANLFAAFLP